MQSDSHQGSLTTEHHPPGLLSYGIAGLKIGRWTWFTGKLRGMYYPEAQSLSIHPSLGIGNRWEFLLLFRTTFPLHHCNCTLLQVAISPYTPFFLCLRVPFVSHRLLPLPNADCTSAPDLIRQHPHSTHIGSSLNDLLTLSYSAARQRNPILISLYLRQRGHHPPRLLDYGIAGLKIGRCTWAMGSLRGIFYS